MDKDRFRSIYCGRADTSPKDYQFIPFIGVGDDERSLIYYAGSNNDYEGVHERLIVLAEYKLPREYSYYDPIGGGVLNSQTLKVIRKSGAYGPLDDDLLDNFIKELENKWK